MLQGLGDADYRAADNALESLLNAGAIVHALENGGFLVEWGSQMYLIPGTTAGSAWKPELIPAFSVVGAVDTGYLRTAVGDAYAGGSWTERDSVQFPVSASASVRPLTEEFVIGIGQPEALASPDPESALLSWSRVEPDDGYRDQRIEVSSDSPDIFVPWGIAPVSLNIVRIMANGQFSPFSATFDTAYDLDQYTWISQVPEFSSGQLIEAITSDDPGYLVKDSEMPPRVSELAFEITDAHESPYLKAKAIEAHLRTNYEFAFANSDTNVMPEGLDPVDWFLFANTEGTSGQFSSAFVALARSVGIPARVASGWAIAEVGVRQTVYSNQAHQWAEVAFADLGWITFDPTPPGGAPYRASRRELWRAELDRLHDLLVNSPQPGDRVQAVDELVRFSRKSTLPINATVDVLAEALASDTNASVRTVAAQALGALGSSHAVRPLADAYANDESPRVRAAAAEALGVLGATIMQLEQGGSVVSMGSIIYALGTGTSINQATEPAKTPVFQLRGDPDVKYLRTGVGEIYGNTGWTSTARLEAPYLKNSALQDTAEATVTQLRQTGDAPRGAEYALLAWPRIIPQGDYAQSNLTLYPISASLPTGVLPISLQTRDINVDGAYRPFDATFRSHEPEIYLRWTANVPLFGAEQVATASVLSEPTLTQLPVDLPQRVRDLAMTITEGYNTPYLKAKAIEGHLRTNYEYAFADSSAPARSLERDPVDWFLFSSQQGTCGQFSSAFVILARAAGIPARVVSGWTVSPTTSHQTVYSDQAHQWAEVAFSDLGWVTFEPTASGGAPTRTPGFEPVLEEDVPTLGPAGVEEASLDARLEEVLRNIAADDPQLAAAIEDEIRVLSGEGSPVVEQIEEQLSNNPDGNPESASELLEALGASAIPLENGGSVINWGKRSAWLVGTTTAQASRPPQTPVFRVSGGSSTGYLRTSTGHTYSNGSWGQITPAELAYQSGQSLPDLVGNRFSGWDATASETTPRVDLPSLVWTQQRSSGLDEITVSAHPLSGNIPARGAPISVSPALIGADGTYFPFSATFEGINAQSEYSWTAQEFSFSRQQLDNASFSNSRFYTQSPTGLPDRIRELALGITDRYSSDYRKARAIETFLSSQYTYAFASPGAPRPPARMDPVDWFLFERREGTCGQFSSAFAVLARSVGIPARVVSGWAVGRTDEPRTVFANQAHQWAEVAFEEIGWITFEPTASGGAQSRADGDGDSGSDSGSGSGSSPPLPSGPQGTLTEIISWPPTHQLGLPFTVGGSVTTFSGVPVDNIEVEIFINRVKENGGIKVAQGIANNGKFSFEVRPPEWFERGSYQLIAHTIGGSDFLDSWSDPEIAIYSGASFQLKGPSEVTVDELAAYGGRLSESDGDPIINQRVEVMVDGIAQNPVNTDGRGEFSFEVSFRQAGRHSVAVLLTGADYILDNAAALEVTAILPSEIVIQALPAIRAVNQFSIDGVLLDHRGDPLEGQLVTIAVSGDEQAFSETDAEGKFQLDHQVDAPGLYELTVTFPGDGNIRPSSYSSFFPVPEQVAMDVDGELFHAVGAPYRLSGSLTSVDGRPLPSLPVTISMAGRPTMTLQTDTEGGFAWETIFDAPTEANVTIEFAGNADLEPFRLIWPITVGAPEIVVEAPEPVARGDTLPLRGVVVVGSQLASNIDINVNGATAVRTNSAGAFVLRHPVPSDAVLGPTTLELTAPGLEAATTVSVQVKSVASIIVTPLDRVRLGRPLLLEARLLNDRGEGIANATLDYGQGSSATTGPDGVAMLTLNTPGKEEALSAIPVTFSFDGDEFNLPLTYFVGLHVPPATFNWLLWIGLPAVLALGAAGAFAARGRRLSLMPLAQLAARSRSRLPGGLAERLPPSSIAVRETGTAEAILELSFQDLTADAERVWTVGEQVLLRCVLTGESGQPLARAAVTITWDDSAPRRSTTNGQGVITDGWSSDVRGPHKIVAAFAGDSIHAASTAAAEILLRGRGPTRLEIEFIRLAEDLPNIWGIGEHILADLLLLDESGQGVSGVTLSASIGEADNIVELLTDADGRCRIDWTGTSPGSYTATVEFGGDDDYLSSSSSREFAIVNFREEIVRRYNTFLPWIRERVSGISDEATPREMELIVVASGVSIDQQALEVLLSRFEEADYSLHDIDRPRFEAMFRAGRRISEDLSEA